MTWLQLLNITRKPCLRPFTQTPSHTHNPRKLAVVCVVSSNDASRTDLLLAPKAALGKCCDRTSRTCVQSSPIQTLFESMLFIGCARTLFLPYPDLLRTCFTILLFKVVQSLTKWITYWWLRSRNCTARRSWSFWHNFRGTSLAHRNISAALKRGDLWERTRA